MVLMNKVVSLWVVKQATLVGDVMWCDNLEATWGILWLGDKKARILVWKLKPNNDSGDLCHASNTATYLHTWLGKTNTKDIELLSVDCWFITVGTIKMLMCFLLLINISWYFFKLLFEFELFEYYGNKWF